MSRLINRLACVTLIAMLALTNAARADESLCNALETLAFTGVFLDTIPQTTSASDLGREVNRMSSAISAAQSALAGAGDAITPLQLSQINGFLNDLQYAMLLAGSTPRATLVEYLARPEMASRRAAITAMGTEAGCTPPVDQNDVDAEGETGAESQLAGLGQVGSLDSALAQRATGGSLFITPRIALLVLAFFVVVSAAVYLFIKRDKRNRRRARRYYCHTSTNVRSGLAELDTTIVDISRVGAKIIAPPDIKAHAHIKIRVDTEWADGRVVWANEHFAGIVFPHALSRVQVRNVISQKLIRKNNSYYYNKISNKFFEFNF